MHLGISRLPKNRKVAVNAPRPSVTTLATQPRRTPPESRFCPLLGRDNALQWPKRFQSAHIGRHRRHALAKCVATYVDKWLGAARLGKITRDLNTTI